MIRFKSLFLGVLIGMFVFGGYLHAREFITAWDDRNIASHNDEHQSISRKLRQFGRGETDSDITYLKLYNSAGNLCYIYPDSAGTGITVSTTKP